MHSSIGTNFPFSFGQTQCSSRLHSPRQTSLTTPANVSLVCLETSHYAPRSSNYDQQHDTILFEMVDGLQSLRNRNSYPSPRTQCIPLYGRQSLWMGSSFRADGRWKEDQPQLHINMLEMIAIRFALVEKRKEKSPGSATITNRSPSQTPRGRGNRQIQTSTNRTKQRKALRLALSSPSEVIAMLKGLKNTRTKWYKVRHKTNRLL